LNDCQIINSDSRNDAKDGTQNPQHISHFSTLLVFKEMKAKDISACSAVVFATRDLYLQ
jgi:hypothetical protein